MRTKSMLYLCAVMVFGLLLSGCGCFMQAQKGETPPPPAPVAVAPAPEAPAPMAVEPAPAPAPEAAPAPVPVVMLKDINFDFDKYNIRSGDAEILKQDQAWFAANPGMKLWIEGNCDERGTIEYNLALGQRRADSTKSFLANLGIDGKLMETLSYGKERPLCKEHNEECWAKNRNAHFRTAQ